MRVEKIKKDSNEYYNVKDFFVEFDIGHASLQLGDLFNGDKDLGKINLFVTILNYKKFKEKFCRIYG